MLAPIFSEEEKYKNALFLKEQLDSKELSEDAKSIYKFFLTCFESVNGSLSEYLTSYNHTQIH